MGKCPRPGHSPASKLEDNVGHPFELGAVHQVLAVWHPVFKAHATAAALIEEVTEHPILDLFRGHLTAQAPRSPCGYRF